MPSACGTLDKLPAEVRENIYAELFCRARAILEKPGPKGVSPSTEKYLSAISIKYGAALLQTCRLIHNEARPFLAMYLHVDVRLIRNIGFTALFPKSSFYAQKLRILTVAYEDVNGFYINYCFPQLQLLYLVGKPGAAPDQQGYEIKCSRDDTDADRQGYVYGSIDNELIRRTLAGFYGDRRFSRLKAEFDGFLGHLKIYQSFYLCLQWPNLGAEFHRAWIDLTVDSRSGEVVKRLVSLEADNRVLLFKDNVVKTLEGTQRQESRFWRNRVDADPLELYDVIKIEDWKQPP